MLEDRATRLERDEEESHRHGANFIYAVLGIALVGNIIASAFKKS